MVSIYFLLGGQKNPSLPQDKIHNEKEPEFDIQPEFGWFPDWALLLL